MEEFKALLAAPGMETALRIAPVVAGAIWLFITVSLWRGGFTDLVEKITRPRWAGRERARALAMLPVRAVLLMLVAGLGTLMTMLGLMFNVAVILNVVELIRSA